MSTWLPDPPLPTCQGLEAPPGAGWPISSKPARCTPSWRPSHFSHPQEVGTGAVPEHGPDGRLGPEGGVGRLPQPHRPRPGPPAWAPAWLADRQCHQPAASSGAAQGPGAEHTQGPTLRGLADRNMASGLPWHPPWVRTREPLRTQQAPWLRLIRHVP